MNRITLFLVTAVLTLPGALVSAQALSDPTRPAVDDAALSAPESGGGAEPVSIGLQSIIHRKGARPAAIINGEYVELGGRVGESRLSAVAEDHVVLTGPGGKEELALTPGIVKKPMQPKPVAVTGKSHKKSRKPARKK